MSTITAPPGIGILLRDWRQRRRMSQLALSTEAAVSARHLSFVETGRAKPSRELVLHLAERLEVPLRERNALLMAAGYAPVYGERPLDDDDMDPVRRALDMILAAHEPYPAVIVDRVWNLVTANAAPTNITIWVGLISASMLFSMPKTECQTKSPAPPSTSSPSPAIPKG